MSNHSPFDRNSFSGTSYYMYHALAENPICSVLPLGNHRPPRRIIDRLFMPARPDARPLRPDDFDDGLDVILSLVSTDLVSKYSPLTKVPIVHCTDATPSFLRDFYGKDLPADTVEKERHAYESADLILFSSDFMLNQALLEFGKSYAPKMAALTWGANLDSFPTIPPHKPPLKPLRLLFIGKDWARKGGDVVVATLQELQRRGVAAELHLVGTSPDEDGAVENVINHGHLNKNKRRDWSLIQKLLNEAHFLVLPTKADCTPMVVAEANSHGVPVLITDVGGVSSLMRPGCNGEMLPPEANASNYAARLMALSADPVKYEALSRSSFEHFMEHLTWTAWSKALTDMLKDRFVLDGPAN